MSPVSFSTAIDFTWMWGSLGHAPPRGTLRSQLASRASLSVPHRSSKALRSYMCYQMPFGYLSRVGDINPHPSLSILRRTDISRQMARSGRSSRTWRVTTKGPRSNIVASAIHSFSSCAKTIPSVCSLESPSVARSDGKICHPWEKKFVAVHEPSFSYTNRLTEDIALYCWLVLQRHNWHVQNSRKRECTWFEWRRTACNFNPPSCHDKRPKNPVAHVV
jgi:hypothetical protein